MKAVLFVLLDLVVLVIIVLIFLKFRFDRVGLRVDMCWKSVRTLLCAAAKETLQCGKIPLEERQAIKAFMKSRRQSSQVQHANKLKSFLVISKAETAFLAEQCMRYNEAVQQFNHMCEKPLWRFVAKIFRIKPRIAIELYDAM